MIQSEAQIEKLDEIVWLSILYDFYGDLLSDHKKHIFEDYVLNDLSLGEIAAEQGISRQGVYDIVKRCTVQLKNMKINCHWYKDFNQLKKTWYDEGTSFRSRTVGDVSTVRK